MPKRLESEVLHKVRYINTLTFTFISFAENAIGVKENIKRGIIVGRGTANNNSNNHTYNKQIISPVELTME